MAPPKRRSCRNKQNLMQLVALKVTQEADEDIKTGGVTYFVDEEGRYYRPTQSLVNLPTGNKQEQEQEQEEEDDITQSIIYQLNMPQNV